LVNIIKEHPFIFFSSKRSEFYEIIKHIVDKNIYRGSLINLELHTRKDINFAKGVPYQDALYFSKGA